MSLTRATIRRGDVGWRRARVVRVGRTGRWLTMPMGLWLLAWLSINTGPWNFSGFGHGQTATLNALRAVFPLIVFAVGIVALLGGRSRQRNWVEKGLWGYGGVALLACTGAEGWFNQAYWGLAFLGALAAAELALRGGGQMEAVERLNILSWAMTTAALVTMLFLARDVLMADDVSNSAYGVVSRFERAHGYGISRSTGLSRMAVVPAIISLALIFSASRWQKLVSVIVFLGSTYVIWIMQARGSLFAFAATFFFVLLFGHKRGQGMAIFLAFVFAATVFLVALPQDELHGLWMHATRNTGEEGFATASGRFEIWGALLNEWTKSPLFGYGPQGDRLFDWNAQNAFIYALLCGGLIGGGLFVTAMLSAWRALLVAAKHVARFSERERQMFQITGALLVFNTLRSIPENNAAVFSVDLLLQYPAMIYLIGLAARAERPRRMFSVPRLRLDQKNRYAIQGFRFSGGGR
jgi:O-antigen ligase